MTKIFKKFKFRNNSNYQLLHWSVFVSTVIVMASKILELSSELTLQIIIRNPELAQYSTMVKLYIIFT